jgi:N-methylhydantoinase A
MAAQCLEFTHVEMYREVDIRYTMQFAEVTTPVARGDLVEADVAQIGADFEMLYEQLYGKGAGYREAGLQVITYRVFAVGHMPFKPVLPRIADATGEPIAAKEHRRVFLDVSAGWQDTPIYDYDALRCGHAFDGPAVIEAPTTTVAVPPGATASVDHLGSMIIRFEQRDT